MASPAAIVAVEVIARRDFIIGAACATSAVVGNVLKPRRSVVMLRGGKLSEIVPASFGGWVSEDVGDPLAINGPGTLSAQLYNEIVGRNYVNAKAQTQVTMLLAYGGRQSDELQLHRPEICYPAFGFALTRNEPVDVPLVKGVTIPARRLIAESDDHQESVLYWSRLGEALPQDGGGQRKARLEIAMQGVIPDGILCRFSTLGNYPEYDWAILYGFVRELVAAVPSASRKVLIGTNRANLL